MFRSIRRVVARGIRVLGGHHPQRRSRFSHVITIAQNGAFTYAGPSTTNLMPGGTVSFSLLLTCTAGCPTQVTPSTFRPGHPTRGCPS
jgi:hypothetical protein